MDKALFLAGQTAGNMMRAQAMVANNMANATTVGFKADRYAMIHHEIEGDLNARTSARMIGGGVDMSAGRIISTTRELDVAISGNGLMVVEPQGRDGEEAYTRAGDLQINREGMLTDNRGNFILGEGGPIPIPPYEQLKIGANGMVAIVPPGGGLVELDRLKLVSPEDERDLYKGDDGLIRFKEGAEIPDPDPGIRVASGFVEGANVNAAGILVEMMTLSRQYEMNVKLMSRMDEAEGKANSAIAN